MGRKAAILFFTLVALIAGFLLLARTLQARYAVLRAYTDDASGLAEGTSVRLNGIPIGYLDKLNLTTSLDPKRKVEIVMKVERRFLGKIPQDSLVSVAATNLLGNYFVDIIEGHSTQPVAENAELQTSVAVDPNKLLAQMGNEFQEISTLIDRFGKVVAEGSQGHGNIAKWSTEGAKRLDQVAAEYNELLESVKNSKGNLGKIDELSAQADTTQKRLNDLIGGLQNGQGTAGKLQSLTSELNGLTAEANQLTASLKSDQGPAARLQKIQERFDDLSQRIDKAADRMNAGLGTLGQFTVNPQLSTALAKTNAEFQALAKGVRTNPKKFLSFHISLF